VVLAVAGSLAMERQYTAVTQIVIEPPAGSDLRAAMTVSPIYLESLKTYEYFAAGDQLFQKAASQFNLRAHFGARPIESIKHRVLRVGIVRNTRILEIAVTLPDAAKALALARYLARDLGPAGVRVNLVAAGPVRTMAAKSIPSFKAFEDTWDDRAPLGWDVSDGEPVARACVALLSDWFPMTTGEMLHVDGGVHAVGA